MKVIPAIDIISGHPVRLSEGDYSRKTSYSLSALDAAKAFEDGGLTRLHLVDLDAAKGSGNNLKILEEIASRTSLTIDFGGGIRSRESLNSAFDAGAAFVNVGSLAAKDPGEVIRWNEIYPGRIILSSDVRDGFIAVSGWQENTKLEIIPFIRDFIAHGITAAVVTDISKDGMLQGPSFALYGKLINELPGLSLIASGGVSSPQDILALKELGVSGVIVGKAYYEGRVTIHEMKEAEC